MENPIKMDDLGVPLFFGNIHIYTLFSSFFCGKKTLELHNFKTFQSMALANFCWRSSGLGNKSPYGVKHGIHLRRIPNDNFWKPTKFFQQIHKKSWKQKRVEQLHDLLMEWRETCKQEIMSIILLSPDDSQSSSLSANAA